LGLRSRGLLEGDKIAMISENCHRFLETYFAAAKLGSYFVPINYRLSPSDFVYILNNSGACTLIAQPRYITWLSEKRKELPNLRNIILTESPLNDHPLNEFDDYEEFIRESPSGIDNQREPQDSHIAQIYYTSGTTGHPKGVILTHKNNEVHTQGTISELNLAKSDRWLHVAPMFHLADAWAVWSITKVGGVHVIIPAFLPDAVLKAIEEHKVTLSNFIPTMLNILVNHPKVNELDTSSLRLILSGGAPISKEIVRKIIKIFKCNYIQTYGLTETSPFLTMSILPGDMEDSSLEEKLDILVTAGRPFFNVQLKVVKEDGTEVLQNNQDVGEIVVKGDTITPGYWNLTKETKIRIKDGWLYTRDLAKMDFRGYVTIVDRKDDMIITGGENVFSIEVENILYSHPQIFEACVIGLPDPIWGEKVTAVVVLKEGKEVSEHEIIEFCKSKLTHFKAPKKVIFADELPKTGSAKIQKRRVCSIYKEMGE
jgi:acyl-CoA synthetase (AMP-forming)/AMP-acid ligase II